jgi:hypothetical protein
MSENIPYIIAENGYYYVAYKEKVKVPYIAVSAKGVANGLSEEYNDGWDFGPDSYSPTSTSAIPYTQTSGWQEAETYAGSVARYSSTGSGYILPEVRLLDGKFILSADVTIPTFPNVELSIPSFSIVGNGYGLVESGTYIVGNGYNLNIGNETGTQTSAGGLLIQGLNSNNLNYVFQGGYAANPQIILRDMGLSAGSLNLLNANNIAQINMDNVFVYGGAVAYLGQAYQLSATNLTTKGGFILGNASNPEDIKGTITDTGTAVNQIGVVNMAEGIQINYGDMNLDFTVWELDSIGTSGIGGNGITNNVPSGDTFTLNINVGTMVINTGDKFFAITSTSVGTLNIKMHIKHLTFQTDVNDWTVPSGINIEEFTVDDITNLTSTATSSSNLPILSSTSGTTAGTVGMRFTEYASSHKKLYITVNGYENDTTTDQTINFPIVFNTYEVIVANTTGLTISATTSGITITAPDATTTYSGIVIVEGY